MPKFPNEKELKEIRRLVSRTKGSQGLSPEATPLDRAKYDVCGQLLVYMKKKKISQRELAALLDAPETRISEIIHYRIEKFTLDRLIAYLQIVKPMLTVRLA